MWTVKVVGLGLVALSLSLEVLVWVVRRRRPKNILNEVLFFPSEITCTEAIFTPSLHSCLCTLPHGVETSFSRLLCHILSTSSSLDLCVFAFSNMDLCRAVLALHNRGVVVRILTDKDYAAITGSQIGVLRKAGICVRCGVKTVYMHHKFVVIDGRLLINGSLNWTVTAVQSNMENVLITEVPKLVQPFIKEFHRLWEQSDPSAYLRSGDQNPAQNRNDVALFS
ncbi:mitochondrial cardiolipin hydrolase [Cynoglossus semilaevis]|uniref:mitochondrial cardiolipin hydrolase n=1 Tax=Cynoglossus semilaevis TaxID=244447 RepID=UPI0004976479|nr:mitochondrial cardiolipin hydrolase [Cynoglossus semilaevis]XP_008315787.1 mitochondrial cardiolipin hydrolase [Cynoglossus semilaevis]XP_024914399.1 mitochondrial cardiolipin hydrolase [Cynoglossus semilaevis]